MAKTVDELVVKMSVEGQVQINESVKSMDNLDAATKRTGETLKGTQGNVRNVAFQVQDMAVQIAGGTSAFVAMGQQLPQLLGGFGVMGAVIGAVAAIAIPLARVGLEALGVDMRNLKEMTDGLSASNQAYLEAQKQNLPTLQGMGNSYGVLTEEAKRFFEIKEQILQQKTEDEASRAVKQLAKDYGFLTDARLKNAQAVADASRFLPPGGAMAGGSELVGLQLRVKMLGLTADQAVVVAEKLKGIDASSPEKTVSAISDVLKYLKEIGPETDGFRREFEKTLDPLMKVNEELIRSKTNIKAAAEEASNFNAQLLEGQSKSIVDVGNARRSFDQVRAIGLEAQQKIAEFTAQANEKSSKDQVNRSREVAAFTQKTNAEAVDKQKDFYKAQNETYRSSLLGVDAKRSQLRLESDILDIQDKGRYDMAFNVKFAEDVARAEKEHADTLINIGEQRRKNLITAAASTQLEKEAAGIQAEATKNAEQARTKAIKDFQLNQEMEIMKKSIEDQITQYEKLGEIIRGINDRKVELNFEKSLMGLSPLQKQFAQIDEAARNSARALGQAYAATFGEIATQADAARFAAGLSNIEQGAKRIAGIQKDNILANRTWDAGVKDSWASFVETATNNSDIVKNSFQNFTSGLEDAFAKLVTTGKLSFHDLANSILADLAKIMVRKAVLGIGTFFGLPGLADGGPVMPNQPYVVGERGPELFMPKGAGSIIPNHQLATASGSGIGGQTTVNYNIQAVDAASFRSMVARDPSFIYAVTEQGRRSQPTRRAM